MEKEPIKQERKARSKNGERSQKMMSFRVDDDVRQVLEAAANKGRLINDLLREWAKAHPTREPQDYPPEENSLEDYQP